MSARKRPVGVIDRDKLRTALRNLRDESLFHMLNDAISVTNMCERFGIRDSLCHSLGGAAHHTSGEHRIEWFVFQTLLSQQFVR